jgi:ABC-2 type transport system permease protein
VPGIMVFGLLAALYGNLAVFVAALRDEGALKRIKVTPLQPAIYLAANVASCFFTAAILVTTTLILGMVAFNVKVQDQAIPGMVVAVLLGAACLSFLGLATSGMVPNAGSASPIVNAAYLPLAIASGVFYPLHGLPSWAADLIGLFPIRALTHALQVGFDPSRRAAAWYPGDLAVLAVWTVIGMLLALRYFRWDRKY